MKSKTHVYMANLIVKELKNGQLQFPGIGAITPPKEVVDAILAFPGAFCAGAVGPDFYPDMFTGQSVVHPKDSGIWLDLLFKEYGGMVPNHPEKQKAYAFALGFMMHYAGDMYGHYYVNGWARGWFDLSTDQEKLKIITRHILVETYMDSKVPLDINTQFDAPINFIRNCFFSTIAQEQYIKSSIPMPIDGFISIENAIASCANSNSAGILDMCNYFPGWRSDIVRASIEWLRTWQNIAHIFTDDSHKKSEAKNLLDTWANNHLALMLGVPGWAQSIANQIAAILDAINILKPIKDQITKLMLDYLAGVIGLVMGVQVKNMDEAMEYLSTMLGNPAQYLNCGRLYPQTNITDQLDAEMGNYGKTDDASDQQFLAFHQCLNMGKLALIGADNLNDLIRQYNPTLGSFYARAMYQQSVRNLTVQIKTTKNAPWYSSDPSTCGTDDNVYFALILKNGTVLEMLLDTPNHNDFESDQVDTFRFDLPRSVAINEITKLQLRKDYIAMSDDWKPQWIRLISEDGNAFFSADINYMMKGKAPLVIGVNLTPAANQMSIDPKILSFLYSLDGAGHDSANPTAELPWNSPGFPLYYDATLRQTIYPKLFESPVPSKKIRLKSWKGDYLHRPDQPQGVTTWNTGIGNEWSLIDLGNGKVSLKSWKGDYLHRVDQDQGVTTWNTGVGNEWTLESIEDGQISLKSWKNDYLHRPDKPQGVTTWNTGIGNKWIIEEVK